MAEKYSFKPGIDGSSVTVSIDGYCGTPGNCDIYFGFGIGNVQYLTFSSDLDGAFRVVTEDSIGIFIYPSCELNSIADGDVSKLLETNRTFNVWRYSLAGGDIYNWYSISSIGNDENFPLSFQFTNNDISDTFEFKFKSPKFPNGLNCVWNSSVSTGQDFQLFISPDGNNETIFITSFSGNGYVFII